MEKEHLNIAERIKEEFVFKDVSTWIEPEELNGSFPVSLG